MAGSTEGTGWTVHVVEYARAHRQALASLVWGTFDKPPIDTPFAFVVARREDRIVLVDTGFMRERGGARMAEKFGVPHWVSPLRMLGELGIKAEDVTDIVLSHAHFDHAGSIDQFPKAHIHIQKAELLSWIEAMALPQRFSFLTDVLNPDDVMAAVAASREHRLTLIDGDRDDVLPGLHVRLAKGHTLGHQIILLDTGQGRYAVAGDCIYNARNLTGRDGGLEGGPEHGQGPERYLPLGAGIGSAWDQLMSIDRLEEAVGRDRSRIIILHDEARWSAFTREHEVDGFGIYRVA